MLLFFLACTQTLKIAGEELNPPSSMIYGHSVEQRMMIVLSDLPSLCAELQSGEVPRGDWWSLAIWTQNRVTDPGQYSSHAYFRRASDDLSSESVEDTAVIYEGDREEERDIYSSQETTDAFIDISTIGTDDGQGIYARGSYEASFSEGSLSGAFTVEACEGVYLFAGMEE